MADLHHHGYCSRETLAQPIESVAWKVLPHRRTKSNREKVVVVAVRVVVDAVVVADVLS